MTNWNDPRWLDDWYQMLEGQSPADISPDLLLNRHSATSALRQTAEADWKCHLLLKEYYENFDDSLAQHRKIKGKLADTQTSSLPRPKSIESVHPECLPRGFKQLPTAQSTTDVSKAAEAEQFANRCLSAALPWFDTSNPPNPNMRSDAKELELLINVPSPKRILRSKRRRRISIWLQGSLAAVIVSLVVFGIYQASRLEPVIKNSSKMTVVPDQQVDSDSSELLVGAERVDNLLPSHRPDPRPRLRAPVPLVNIPLPPALPIARYQKHAIPGGNWTVALDASWKQPTPNERQSNEIWDLDAGRADLELESGLTVHLRGPATIKRDANGEWMLTRGTAYMQWSPGRAGQINERPAIHTASVELRPDAAANWYISVDPNGETLVQVIAGEVTARSRAIDSKQPWSLKSDQQWQAHFWPNAAVHQNSSLPAAPGRAVTVDRQGKFSGLIDIGGQALPWSTPERFAQVMDSAAIRLEKGDDEFVDQWNELARGWQRWEKSQLEFNGRSLPPPSLEDLWQMSNEKHWPPRDVGNGSLRSENGNGFFEFKFESHGTQQEFSNLQEIDAFMRQSMGPLFAEWQALMQQPNGLGVPDKRPETPPLVEDPNGQQVANPDQIRHRTPWGNLDGKTLLIDDRDELVAPIRER